MAAARVPRRRRAVELNPVPGCADANALGHAALDAAALPQPPTARNTLARELPSTVTDTRPNIAATARHLAGRVSDSSFGTASTPLLAALTSTKSLTMG
jgi:hypothetical protein